MAVSGLVGGLILVRVVDSEVNMVLQDLAFHQWLRQLRKARDLTQEVFAHEVGCAVSTIRKLEHGMLRPSRDLAIRLAQVLKLPQDLADQFVRSARSEEQSDGQQSQLSSLGFSSHLLPLIVLPDPITPFVGREDDVDYLVGRFNDPNVRLLILTGPGGVGKTRLAIRVGEQLAKLPDQELTSIVFVPLAALRDPKLVLDAIAKALHIAESGGHSVWQRLTDALRNERVVLILDTLEHLLDASHDIAALLTACPQLRMLVTSRSVLAVYGEYVFPVAPLPLPEPISENDLGTLAENAACSLFVGRARAANPAFRLTASSAPTIAEIVRRLDGLPLALELAAARSRLLSVDALLARLTHRLDFLTSGPRTVDKRQQTLRSTIDWSYDLLDPVRQQLFKRLSVFVGSYDVSAIMAICYDQPMPEPALLDDLDVLIGSSLVRAESASTEEPRFRLLDMLREYAYERLAADGAAEDLQHRHAEYYRRRAEQAAPELVGAAQVAWLDRLEQDHDNLRAALHWANTNRQGEIAVAMAAALGRFWWLRGYLNEGRRWLQLGLGHHDGVPPELRAKALYWLGILAIHQGDYIYANVTLVDGLALYQSIQETEGIALALNALGVVANREGDHKLAQARYEESLAIARANSNIERMATGLNNLGYTLILRGDLQPAQTYLRESLALARNQRDIQGQAFALTNLGLVALAQKRYWRAQTLLAASLRLFVSLGDLRSIAEALEGLAEAALAKGDASTAAQRLGAAAACRREIAAPLAAHARSRIERITDLARQHLGEGTFAEEWMAGELQAKQRRI
jgi:predicted ATPase/transcriptional regulator with XRE-family HTH domain/Tfp pilus assembly protein PilF